VTDTLRLPLDTMKVRCGDSVNPQWIGAFSPHGQDEAIPSIIDGSMALRDNTHPGKIAERSVQLRLVRRMMLHARSRDPRSFEAHEPHAHRECAAAGTQKNGEAAEAARDIVAAVWRSAEREWRVARAQNWDERSHARDTISRGEAAKSARGVTYQRAGRRALRGTETAVGEHS
jgi:hypothetical protein